MKAEAVLFDLDGTLTNTLPDLAFITNRTLEDLGYPVRTDEEIRQFVGNGMKRLIERALPEGVELTPEILSLMKANYLRYQNTLTTVYPGIPELLKTLRDSGIKVGVVSNKPDAAAQEVVKHYLPGLVDFVTGARDDMRVKPYPEVTLFACEKLGASPEHCIYIGDSETDVETGNNAGMVTLSVTWGFRSVEELKFHGACHFADTPEEVLKFIEYTEFF